MPHFYSHKLTHTLQEMLADHLELDPSEQLNLFQELALTRAAASEAVALYSAAEALPDSEKTRDIKTNAALIMVQQLKDVADMCTKAAGLHNNKDKFDLYSLRTIVMQISRIAFECFGDTPEARQFDKLLKEKIKLPGEVQAAENSPDEMLRQMLNLTTGVNDGG